MQLPGLQALQRIGAGIAVVDGGRVEREQVAGGDQAGLVGERAAELQGEVLPALHATAGVVERGRGQGEVARCTEHASAAVVDTGQPEPGLALGDDRAVAVVQRAAVDLQCSAGQDAASAAGIAVDDGRAVALQGQIALRLQAPARIGQRAAADLQRAQLAADGAGAVVQRLAAGVHDHLPADHAAGAVGQPGTLQLHAAACLQRARIVADGRCRGHVQIGAGHQRAGAVVERSTAHAQLPGAGDGAGGVVIQQSGDLHLQGRAGRGQGAALVVDAGGGDAPAAAQQQFALLVLQRLSDVHGGGAGAGDLQRALGVAQRLRTERDHAIAADAAAAVVQRAARGEREQLAAGRHQGAASGGEIASVDAERGCRGGGIAQVGGLPMQGQCAVAEQLAGVAEQGLRREVQLAVAGVLEGALGVVEQRADHGQIASAGDDTAGVVQRVGLETAGTRAAGDDAAAAVVQLLDVERDAVGTDGGAAMVDGGGGQRQHAAGDDGALAAVHAVAVDHQAGAAGVAERALRVDQLVGSDLQGGAVGGDAATGVVQLPADGDAAIGAAGAAERAVAVEQRGCLQVQGAIAGDAAGAIVERVAQVHLQRAAAGRTEMTTGGAQAGGRDVDAVGLGRAAGPEIEHAAAQLQAAEAEQAAAGPLQGIGAHRQGAIATVLDRAATVVERAGLHCELATAGQAPAGTVVQQAGGMQLQRRAIGGQDAAMLVDQGVGIHRDTAVAGDAAAAVVQATGHRDGGIGGTGGGDRASLVAQRTGSDRQAGVARQVTGVIVQALAHGQLQGLIAERAHAATGSGQRLGLDLHLLGGSGAAGQVDASAGERQSAIAEQASAVAVDRLRCDLQQAGTGLLDLATGIAERRRAQV